MSVGGRPPSGLYSQFRVFSRGRTSAASFARGRSPHAAASASSLSGATAETNTSAGPPTTSCRQLASSSSHPMPLRHAFAQSLRRSRPASRNSRTQPTARAGSRRSPRLNALGCASVLSPERAPSQAERPGRGARWLCSECVRALERRGRGSARPALARRLDKLLEPRRSRTDFTSVGACSRPCHAPIGEARGGFERWRRYGRGRCSRLRAPLPGTKPVLAPLAGLSGAGRTGPGSLIRRRSSFLECRIAADSEKPC